MGEDERDEEGDEEEDWAPARSALRGCSGSGVLTRETRDWITCGGEEVKR